MNGLYVVQHIEVVSFEEDDFGFRQLAAPAGAIDITANGGNGSYFFKRFKDCKISDIAQVKDVLDSLESGYHFRPQLAVRIADYTNDHLII